jgi:hypothetical protein
VTRHFATGLLLPSCWIVDVTGTLILVSTKIISGKELLVQLPANRSCLLDLIREEKLLELKIASTISWVTSWSSLSRHVVLMPLYCSSQGHLTSHLRENPSHRRIYSRKLHRLVLDCNLPHLSSPCCCPLFAQSSIYQWMLRWLIVRWMLNVNLYICK